MKGRANFICARSLTPSTQNAASIVTVISLDYFFPVTVSHTRENLLSNVYKRTNSILDKSITSFSYPLSHPFPHSQLSLPGPHFLVQNTSTVVSFTTYSLCFRDTESLIAPFFCLPVLIFPVSILFHDPYLFVVEI